MIPPGQKLFRNVGICGPSCTGTLFPTTGINIVSATLHSHTAGKKIKLRHIRGGRELNRIVEDEFYNPNYQQVRQLQNETTVLPGKVVFKFKKSSIKVQFIYCRRLFNNWLRLRYPKQETANFWRVFHTSGSVLIFCHLLSTNWSRRMLLNDTS